MGLGLLALCAASRVVDYDVSTGALSGLDGDANAEADVDHIGGPMSIDLTDPPYCPSCGDPMSAAEAESVGICDYCEAERLREPVPDVELVESLRRQFAEIERRLMVRLATLDDRPMREREVLESAEMTMSNCAEIARRALAGTP